VTSTDQTYACFAAGGTGGHVVPALTVARELVGRGRPASSIVFVGSDRGIEKTLVPEAGFELRTLPGRGIQRKLSLAAILAILGILHGIVEGIGVIRRMRPRVVVVFGGYASVPSIVGAVLWRVPIVVVARDARVGLADRLGGFFAKASAVPFEGTDLPRAVVTGNPVRSQVVAIDRDRDQAPAQAELAMPAGRTVVGVYTGSLGSRRVNEAVRGLVERWATRDDLVIRHVIGSRDWEAEAARLPELPAGGLVYQPLRYEDRMDLLLAAADVIISRAGGATVAELAVVGLPSILVPLPIATRDHQTFNAAVLVQAGAAVVVKDDELDTDRLERELEPLVADAGRRAEMAAAARRLGVPDAAARVADVIEEHARRG
jgi:undecaprenyldiphospho-muramoylpentapeptide beta-N-acetylglucosaminyltransferase